MIDSGMLELYVAGALPEAEAQAIHQAVQQHTVLQAEVEAIEAAMMAMAEAEAPKRRFDAADKLIAELDATEAKVKSLQPEANKIPWWAIAAAIALLISLIGNVFLYQQNQGMNNRILALEGRQQVLAQEKASLESDFEDKQALIAHLNNPNGELIRLNSTVDGQPFEARVKWNPESGEYTLFQWQLAALSPDQVYQLWAIIDGQPVSAGLLSDLGSGPVLKQLSGRPQAFAITVEPEGGSDAPTLDQMVVLGNVQG
ncbi:MAG: anti-sigma factor [Bacteroidota bacterium]